MSIRVLVADDHEVVRRGLVELFPGTDIQVAAEASGGLQVLELARTHLPDVILLDITMPGGNGLTLAERLKASTNTQTIPIIFLTASQQSDLRQKAMALGAAAYFEKPYDFDYLLAALRAAIEHPHVHLAI